MYRVLYVILLFAHNLHAQEWCAVNDEYFAERADTEAFETWLQEKRIERDPADNALLRTQAVYQIPVVFHVIHNGEEIGTGTNISEDRILDQMRILNEDFRRQHADRVNTPEEFLNVAADPEIEFVLARRDPLGLPTNGILRQVGSRSEYGYKEEILYAESFWPPEDYMNIYIADISFPYIGWSSFPYTDLEGIGGDSEKNRYRDVTAIDFRYVGINPDTGSDFESFGRTLTHEIGHFLGLRHVWGNLSGCSSDDYCADTPNQSEDYLGECPTTPQESCGTNDMYSNFLNYTADACMNIFTLCQKERMRVILENSPRRKSLLSSPALLEPLLVNNDLGIAEIVSPQTSSCGEDLVPVINLINYGQNAITEFSIDLELNGLLQETLTGTSSLQPGSAQLVNFESLSLIPGQDNELRFVITSVNQGTDENDENDISTIRIPDGTEALLPYVLDFESDSYYFTRTESDLLSAWETDVVPYLSEQNLAAVMNFDAHPASFGLFDYLITPLMDLSALTSLDLTFSYAYQAPSSNADNEGLLIAVSTDCGASYPLENVIFEKYGADLGTVAPGEGTFVPQGPVDWNTKTINISRFAGNDGVRLAFIAHHGNAKALYIDDIRIQPTSIANLDLGIRETNGLPLVTCQESLFPGIEIRNYGSELVDDFVLSYALNESQVTENLIDQGLTSGQSQTYPLAIPDLSAGSNELLIEVSAPNGQPDENPANDTYRHHIFFNQDELILPVRETFDPPHKWISTNHSNTSIWRNTEVNGNPTMMARGYDAPDLDRTHWLVSPNLQLDETDSVSMVFNYAYARRTGFSDRLTVLLSVSCGQSFEYVLFDANSDQLSDQTSGMAYEPTTEEEWQEVFVDLNPYRNWNEIRVAFVFTNGNGNNLYLDDIAFYDTGNPNLPRFEDPITVYPNPADTYIRVGFELQNKEEVEIQVLDLAGRMISIHRFDGVLNHTYQIDLPPDLSGMYLIRAIGETFVSSERFIVGK